MISRITTVCMLFIGLLVYSEVIQAQDNYSQHGYESINACILAKFCNDQSGKCKNRCKIRWNEQLVNCVDNHTEFDFNKATIHTFKTRWELNCRVDKLKSMVQQLLPIRFQSEEKQAQRDRLMSSIKKELDRRFQQLYDNE